VLLGPAILIERALTGLSGHWAWAPAAALKAWLLHRNKSFDLIYSSGGPTSAHLAGWMAHKLTGLPWIAEIHDPIVPSDQAQLSSFRARVSRERKLERWLEKRVCNDATAAWWFTNAAVDAARRRHPALAKRGFVVLPGVMPPVVAEKHEYGSSFNIGPFGRTGRTRTLDDFLEGLDLGLQANPQARRVVRLTIYGDDIDPGARQLADRAHLWDVIVCHGRLERNPITGESGRTQVTRKMQQCDALLLLHGKNASCAEYIPSKSYEYFWARRPILALPHLNPQLEELVLQFGGVLPARMNAEGIAQAIDLMWSRWKTRSLEPSSAPPVGVDAAVAEILRRVTESMAGKERHPIA